MNQWRRALVAMAVGVSAAGVPCHAQEQTGVRRVAASDQSLIPLQTRLRFTTMIVLPDDEEILDVVCGDRDYWVISATQNIAHVKPAKAGAETNLNLVTRSGAIYSFLLTEKTGPPDLKVHVDVNADAVAALQSATAADWIIHGHTHRPAVHDLRAGRRRIVLGDWPRAASWLRVEGGSAELHFEDQVVRVDP